MDLKGGQFHHLGMSRKNDKRVGVQCVYSNRHFQARLQLPKYDLQRVSSVLVLDFQGSQAKHCLNDS